MKEYAKSKDYVEYLESMVNKTKLEGEEYFDIEARILHKELSSKPTLPTCCNAMVKFMKEKDEFIFGNTEKNRKSSKLTIRYFVQNRESRAQLFPSKKRGRPAGYTKPHSNKKEKIIEIGEVVESYLEKSRIPYQRNENIILAEGIYGKWLIVLDIAKRGPQQNFPSKIYEVLSMVDSEVEKYSFAFVANISYEAQWKKLSESVKSKLNLSLLKCSNNQNVIEI